MKKTVHQNSTIQMSVQRWWLPRRDPAIGRSGSQRRPPGGCELQLMFLRQDLVQAERRAVWVENVLT